MTLRPLTESDRARLREKAADTLQAAREEPDDALSRALLARARELERLANMKENKSEL